MGESKQIVLSASRRTDIPAFYMDWFIHCLTRGRFDVKNPYNGRIRVVPANADAIHSIVLWSKDFGPFLKKGFGKKLLKMGHRLFFNFTVNSESRLLEPNVPPLKERLDQMKALCETFGPKTVTWRFDPICCYQMPDRSIRDNRGHFERIAAAAADSGITRCVTSFLDMYPKIRKRIRPLRGFSFILPHVAEKTSIVLDMAATLSAMNIRLFTCCEKEVISALPPSSGVRATSCVPNDLLVQLYGGGISLAKDRGQRTNRGCMCGVSVDIGDYRLHPCGHACLFCYANPDTAARVSLEESKYES